MELISRCFTCIVSTATVYIGGFLSEVLKGVMLSGEARAYDELLEHINRLFYYNCYKLRLTFFFCQKSLQASSYDIRPCESSM